MAGAFLAAALGAWASTAGVFFLVSSALALGMVLTTGLVAGFSAAFVFDAGTDLAFVADLAAGLAAVLATGLVAVFATGLAADLVTALAAA